MVIPGHPGGLGKIFLDQNVSWPCGISMQKNFFLKHSFWGVTRLLPYFLCKAYSPLNALKRWGGGYFSKGR